MRRWSLALLVPLLLAGCGGGAKAGGKHGGLHIVLYTTDPDDPDLSYFASEVAKRTDGRIRLVVNSSRYSSADPNAEFRLIRALERGSVKTAYIPSRAWERAGQGLLSFRALQAPFLVADYGLLRRISTGPIGASMLASLGRVGLEGLAIVPSEMRRPLGRRPLVSAASFRGARIRLVPSPTSIAVLQALGATTVTNLDSGQTADALAAHRLDGVESAMHPIQDNNYVATAPYLPSNVVLFPKTATLVVRRDVLARLSQSDRAALRSAAAATARHADPASEERGELAGLCPRVKVVTASPADLASLRQASGPVYAELERDPATARAIRAIESLDGGAGAAATLPSCKHALPARARAATSFPTGRFVTTVTRPDVLRAGLDLQHHPGYPQTLTTILGPGHWRQTWMPRVKDDPPYIAGRLQVRGDQVAFVLTYPKDARGIRDVLRWSYYRGQLVLHVLAVGDPIARLVYSAHPWRKTG
jgi:TRAP-type C4-dicarboxylate transport system substrate-binding protein